jgi:hypothetical protein
MVSVIHLLECDMSRRYTISLVCLILAACCALLHSIGTTNQPLREGMTHHEVVAAHGKAYQVEDRTGTHYSCIYTMSKDGLGYCRTVRVVYSSHTDRVVSWEAGPSHFAIPDWLTDCRNLLGW